MIILENISKIYDSKPVLSNISLTVERGSSIVFCGYNGTGKSTLLKITAGLVAPDSGRVVRNSHLRFSYIPEHFPRLNLTVRQYINRMGRIDGLSYRKIAEKSIRLYKDFFLEDMVDMPLKHLSKGTLQKIGVIQALLTPPDVLLLDEPLSGQDVESQAVFIGKVKELRECGISIMMSCHEKYLMYELAERIYTLQDGGLTELEKDPLLKKELVLIFDRKEGAEYGTGIPPIVHLPDGRWRLEVSEERSTETLLFMLQHGWTLKEMLHEKNM